MKRFRMEFQLQFFHHFEHKFWIYLFTFAWSCNSFCVKLGQKMKCRLKMLHTYCKPNNSISNRSFEGKSETESTEARDQRCSLLRMNIHINSHFPPFLSDISRQSLTKSEEASSSQFLEIPQFSPKILMHCLFWTQKGFHFPLLTQDSDTSYNFLSSFGSAAQFWKPLPILC